MEESMKKSLAKSLERVSGTLLESLSQEICALLIGKDLTFEQAEAILDYSKIILRRVKI